ncbi:hypothetical protein ACS0TY_023934 [Phlomoides rotata]
MERIQLISPCNSSCVAHFPCSVLLLVVTDGLLKGQIKSWDDQEISRVLRRIAISRLFFQKGAGRPSSL